MLPQGTAITCGSGLASRKGRKAAPIFPARLQNLAHRPITRIQHHAWPLASLQDMMQPCQIRRPKAAFLLQASLR
ncbi:hypothetical protein C6A77_21220 [Pseudomonas sp. AFG_SD02_1510_Pfu_092]|nr:hypothetical protein C6A77_21220 [Pseudomonas sp. AFG_SD02_1510_Pfu_092]